MKMCGEMDIPSSRVGVAIPIIGVTVPTLGTRFEVAASSSSASSAAPPAVPYEIYLPPHPSVVRASAGSLTVAY